MPLQATDPASRSSESRSRPEGVDADGIRADLAQLAALLDDAIDRLTASFEAISSSTAASVASGAFDAATVGRELDHALTALQFHDIATQIVSRSIGRLDGTHDADRSMTDVAAARTDRGAFSVNQTRMTVGAVELF